MTDNDELTISTSGSNITGWTEVSVECSCETVPRAFSITMTEQDSQGKSYDILCTPGDVAIISIGGDPVVTGYIDRYEPNIDPAGHSVKVTGRSTYQDAVDCSADITNSQVSATDALSLANSMLEDFDLSATSLSGNGPAIPQFTVMLGETPHEIIERVTRYSGFLAYDGSDGNLIMAQAGASSMSSGFTMPGNCQSAGSAFSMDERFSKYTAVMMAQDKLNDIGGQQGNLLGVVNDNGVKRYRPKIIISEQFVMGQFIALQRAKWEMARRFGRSQAITVTCDSWRDDQGKLWEPNAFAPVNIPQARVANVKWVIASVHFIRNADRGTVAEVTLMPKEAFTPEPSVLQLFDWQVGADSTPGGAS